MTQTLTRRQLGGLDVYKADKAPSHFTMLLYGHSGIGKTVLAASADAVPELRSVLLIDVNGESGAESARAHYPNIDIVRVSTWPELLRVGDDLFEKAEPYCTVIIDTLTEAQRLNMRNIMAKVAAQRDDQPEEVPSKREYLISLEQVRKFVRKLRQMPINTIFTALAEEDTYNEAKARMILPQFGGMFQQEIPGMVSLCAYYYIKEIEGGKSVKYQRSLLTAIHPTIVAKKRFDKMPDVIRDPDMATLYKYMKESNNV